MINGIGVPSHFFLAMLHVKTGNSIAFLVPNTKRGGDEALSDKMMSINGLERKVSSLKIFRNLPLAYRPYPWQRKRVDQKFWRLKTKMEELNSKSRISILKKFLFGFGDDEKKKQKRNSSSSSTTIKKSKEEKLLERVNMLLEGRSRRG